jgi:transketolase
MNTDLAENSPSAPRKTHLYSSHLTMNIPKFTDELNDEQISFMEAFTKSCRRSILEMVKNSQSGHPGGSLSTIDYLATLYAFVISQTGENVVVSHGHVSPSVYSVLGELGYIDKEDSIANFRKIGHVYEGHVTRHVPGIIFGTGPLGAGVSAASGFALAEKIKKSEKTVYALMGDGEAQEGQVHEMIHFAAKHELDNFVLFVDYNKVQLTASLEEIMPIDLEKVFSAGGWQVITVDGHNHKDLWKAISVAQAVDGKPVVILGNTIMGKGVSFMEQDGIDHKSTWHGNAPKPDDVDAELEKTTMTDDELAQIEAFKSLIKWTPPAPDFTKFGIPMPEVDTGEPIEYEAGKPFDCRGAYGKALVDLATRNTNVTAATADLGGSVKTTAVKDVDPMRHIECGIAEQQMISMAGGLSLNGFIPFVSTFGAFISSRAKDQARVNDINQANVKMVATHCGLSVGEDGPTHQAIDDMGSFLGMFNTGVIEPADANQCDRIIRFIASHYGNFYVRMGRHKFEVITKEDGTPFYDKDYVYTYGRTDVIREGTDVTLVASGSMVSEALKAWEMLKEKGVSVELVAATAIKQFDKTLCDSIQKTGKVVTVEDHNTYSGLGSQIARQLQKNGLNVDKMKMMGVEEYQLSGKWNELYASAGLGVDDIVRECEAIKG